MWIGKNWLNNFICHLSLLKKLSPSHTCPLISIHEFLIPYDWLFLEFESFVKGWMWIGKNSLNNCICHLPWFKKHFPIHTHPPTSICESLKHLGVNLFWVWVICKRLNVYWKKNDSIILSVTCHSLRNFLPLIHIPSYPFMNFGNPRIDYWVWVICKKVECELEKNWLNILSDTCHCLRNFSLLIHVPSYPFMNFWYPMIDYFLSLSHL